MINGGRGKREKKGGGGGGGGGGGLRSVKDRKVTCGLGHIYHFHTFV